MFKAAFLVVSWLLIVNIFALLVLNRFNLKPDNAYPWINPKDFSQKQSWDLISLHSRWDSIWYLDIAKNGYQYKGPEKLSNIVFFPIYPALISVLSLVTLNNPILAGWMISAIALVIASIFLYKLVKEFHPAVEPDEVIIFLLVFPTAFFFNTVYTESLFLALSVATFYFALRKRFLLAGVFGLLASLTRVSGILLFLPIAWEYYERFGWKSFLNFRFLPILLIPAGTVSFFLYHYLLSGDLLLFLKVESWWGRSFEFNKEHFNLFSNPAVVNFALDLTFIILALIATVLTFKKLRVSYGLYIFSCLIFALSSGTMMSINRYIVILFPLYILIASFRNQLFRSLWLIVSVLLLGMYITLFVNNYWVG